LGSDAEDRRHAIRCRAKLYAKFAARLQANADFRIRYAEVPAGNACRAAALCKGCRSPLSFLFRTASEKRRLCAGLSPGLATAQSQFRQFFTVQEQTWSGDRLQFRVEALRQTAIGSIDVAEDRVRLEIELPWLLTKVAQQIQRVVKAQAAIMLEKK
jgi:hypothetical protein